MAELRLTTSSFLVLGIIDKLGEASPYDVKIEAARTVAPFWSVPHAQVYAQCDRLLAAGLLSQVRQESGRNRRVLKLTGQGGAALPELARRPGVRAGRGRERGILKLWFGGPAGRARPGATRRARRGRWPDYEELAESVGEVLTPGSARRWSSASGTSG